MTQKVKVSREVADGLNILIRNYSTNELIKMYLNYKGAVNIPLELVRVALSVSSFADALINGYEVEETPEEKWSKRYKLAKEIAMDELLSSEEGGQFETEKSIIEEMARDFGLKIEGVDAN